MPTINKGSDYFGVLTYTGDGAASKTVVDTSAVTFQPDFVWVKGRSGATDHALYDSVRGTTKQLESNTTTAETTETTGLTSFVNGGFTVGNLAQMNTSGATYVAWCWKAGGSTSSNTSGSITSTVSVSTTAGFSVATWTAPSSGNWTIGHGLGVAPSFVITKSRSAGGWIIYHSALGNTKWLEFTTAAAQTGTSFPFNSTSPTSTLITYGNATSWGASANFVTYAWAEIAGFSKFGSYTGNGSTDGPFVYTGFRPKFILAKRTDTAGFDWIMTDSSRSTYNVVDKRLFGNTSDAESSATTPYDYLSNGFKLRNTNTNENASGGTYIYMAFAENPFSSNNRAR